MDSFEADSMMGSSFYKIREEMQVDVPMMSKELETIAEKSLSTCRKNVRHCS